MGISSERFVAIKLLILYLNSSKVVEVDQLLKEYNGNLVVHNCLISADVDQGNLDKASKLFNEMPERNEISWTALLSDFMKCGRVKEYMCYLGKCLNLGLCQMMFTFSSVVGASADLRNFGLGMIILGLIVKVGFEHNVLVSNSLITSSFSSGELDVALRVFYQMEKRGDVSWTAILDICGTTTTKHAFDLILEKDIVCWNSMVSGYSLNGQIEKGKEVFDLVPKKNNVSMNTLVAGYVDDEQCDKVFEVFNQMFLSGETPNKSIFSSILCACASTASLEKGNNLQGKIFKLSLQCDVFVRTALTDMYSKSGDIEIYKQVFNRMPEKSEISWTAMVQGLEKLVLERNLLFFLTKWRVDKGLRYFNSMEKSYGIRPNNRHYTCLVDMFSQPGCLPEAEKLIASMPCQPDSNTWAALLSGFSMHTSEKVAERTAKKLWEMAEEKSGGYVLLSNIYASAGRWVDVLKTRKLMKEKGLKKSSGCSWVEVRNQIHLFYSQDGNHSWRFDSVLKIARGEGCSSWMQAIAGQLHPQSHSLMEGNITSLSSMVCKQAIKGLPSGYVSVYRTIGVGFVSPRVSLV
ncbi:Pentatricopeptide repeat-containing protein [Actinidia chinensis var. chinensis]|uniref:Pentatricopeptide repeat-containing protein n=1 Tax=Actinidia chinensis var. chinensis TaxID=1590841 RepID=A0A2R6RK15_ACTCC|nr:Pentatricopeptide repeat-containing protein [Actinidia chinensis var. chinensis]